MEHPKLIKLNDEVNAAGPSVIVAEAGFCLKEHRLLGYRPVASPFYSKGSCFLEKIKQ